MSRVTSLIGLAMLATLSVSGCAQQATVPDSFWVENSRNYPLSVSITELGVDLDFEMTCSPPTILDRTEEWSCRGKITQPYEPPAWVEP